MAFVECLGFSQKDTMESPLWRETLGRSLGSHDATELVGGMCRGNQSSRAPSTHTVGRSSCNISKPKKVRRRKELW